MMAPVGSRPVVCRLLNLAGVPLHGRGQHIGLVVGARVHMWLRSFRYTSWNPKGRPAGSVEILRDATARECALGYVP
jgi:hypothetical protein